MSEHKVQSGSLEIPGAGGVALRAFSPFDAQELYTLYEANRGDLEKVGIYVPAAALDLIDKLTWPIPEGRCDFCITAEGQIVGEIDYLPRTPSRAEIIYWLDMTYRGKGYARVAVRALTDFCFENLGTQVVSAWVRKDNMPSQKTLTKIGFTPTQESKATSSILYELTSPKG